MREGLDRSAPAGTRSFAGGTRLPSFGLFASALLTGALGLGAFCGSCFLAILGILIYNSAGHHAVNYADSYRYVALPAGLAVLVVSGLVLLGLWFRRKVRDGG